MLNGLLGRLVSGGESLQTKPQAAMREARHRKVSAGFPGNWPSLSQHSQHFPIPKENLWFVRGAFLRIIGI
jgi:hypothetical protein